VAVLHYTLDVRQPGRRRIAVTLEADRTALGLPPTSPTSGTEAEAVLFLPTWTPGSYLIREYSRHLSTVEATDAGTGGRLDCAKVAKNRFRVRLGPDTDRICLRYTVYAHELSVRTADLTTEHAYWNHACVLLWPLGCADTAARIAVLHPPSWQVATTLPQAAEDAVDEQDRQVFVARDLDHAVDTPVLTGSHLERLEWSVHGIPHAAVFDGLGPVRPPARLVEDLTKVIEHNATVFGSKLPYDRYLFLCLFSDQGHGGLEHTDSTTLLGARTDLRGGRDYREFLSLAAHEHFHVWNVKRMRPVEFWSYDYETENHTQMLWLAEGFTAYYDDLVCRRAGVHTVQEYLDTLARTFTNLLSAPGRHRYSLSDSSFDAWIRLYRPDEDSRNSSQNYYGNGSLAALCLDFAIRSATQGAKSLDDAVRELYESTHGQGRGYTRKDVERALAVGGDLSGLLASLVDRGLDPDFDAVLRTHGLRLVLRDRNKPWLGLSLKLNSTEVAFVYDHSPAWESGIAPGDELIAIQGMRITETNLNTVLQSVADIGRPLRAITATRGLLQEVSLVPVEHPFGVPAVEFDPDATPAACALRSKWLGDDVSAR
jgi:predicted metalloprotease with PDZ domain